MPNDIIDTGATDAENAVTKIVDQAAQVEKNFFERAQEVIESAQEAIESVVESAVEAAKERPLAAAAIAGGVAAAAAGAAYGVSKLVGDSAATTPEAKPAASRKPTAKK